MKTRDNMMLYHETLNRLNILMDKIKPPNPFYDFKHTERQVHFILL